MRDGIVFDLKGNLLIFYRDSFEKDNRWLLWHVPYPLTAYLTS